MELSRSSAFSNGSRKKQKIKRKSKIILIVIAADLHGISGSEWDSPVTNVYVVDNLNDGSFVITEKYFLEAAEGHGARFYNILQEFEIIE